MKRPLLLLPLLALAAAPCLAQDPATRSSAEEKTHAESAGSKPHAKAAAAVPGSASWYDLFLSDVPEPEIWEVMGDSEAMFVSNGWVVVDGELLHPPYRIFRNANGIKVNDRLFGWRWPVYYWKPRTEPPRVPVDFPTNAASLFESDQGQAYWRDCVEYLRTVTTNADKPLAADDFLPFIRAIPAVSRAWTEEKHAIFDRPITPHPKDLYIEWRADTNEVECLTILSLTTPRWTLAEEEAKILDNQIAQISTVLRNGGMVLSLPILIGGVSRESYQLEKETAAEFISRMEAMAVGNAPTNQMKTALQLVFRCGEEIKLDPIFQEHLGSYSTPGVATATPGAAEEPHAETAESEPHAESAEGAE